MTDTSMVEVSHKWVDEHTVVASFDGRELPGIQMSALYEWLEVGDENIRRWWGDKRKLTQLVEGKDFVNFVRDSVRNSGRGRKEKDYLLTPDAALRVSALTNTSKGRSTLAALSRLATMVENSDPELIKYMHKRHEERTGRAMPGRPWSERLTGSFMKHYCYVSSSRPGWWSVLMATNTVLFALEDCLMTHCLPCARTDLPDGSIGKHWANYRREELKLEPVSLTAPLYLPDQQVTVHPTIYPPDERGYFDAWLMNTYIPQNLPDYLARKFRKEHGVLPPHSAADNTCRQFTGKPACLPDSSRQAIDNSPERIIRAAERPSLN